MNKDIWVLTDYRIGNSVQALAIAEGLGINYEIKKLEYNFLANLPSFLIPEGLFHLQKNARPGLDCNQAPKIIISSGRRCASIAKFLKNKYPDVRLIQVLKPETSLDDFDLLILPKHDRIDLPKDFKCKIIRTLGSLNNIDERIKDYSGKFNAKYPDMKDFIGVLVGGNSKNYKYSQDDAKELCQNLERIHSKNDMPLFITFSRRTPEFLKDMINEKFHKPNRIFDPAIDADPNNNPYIGMLKYAKYLIITSDSVSMCSEAASSGKPLYIYSPANFKSRKHNKLLEELYSHNIARPLDSTINQLEEYEYARLDDLSKVVEYIKEHWL